MFCGQHINPRTVLSYHQKSTASDLPESVFFFDGEIQKDTRRATVNIPIFDETLQAVENPLHRPAQESILRWRGEEGHNRSATVNILQSE